MNINKKFKHTLLAGLAGVMLLPTIQAMAASPTDWMGQVDGRVSLSQLSIPGTHDSATKREQSDLFDPIEDLIAQCQGLTITQQLNSGIRAFDLRVRRGKSSLPMHHGVVYLGKDLKDVLNEFKTFLQKHPTETLVANLQEEHTPMDDASPMKTLFMPIWNGSEFSSLFWKPSKPEFNPKLEGIRGKIVVIRNRGFNFSGSNFENTPDWDNQTAFSIQNNYLVDPSQKNKKWEDIQRQLNNAASENTNKIYINFTSAVGTNNFLGIPTLFPSDVAEYINPLLNNHLIGRDKRTGILLMDFPERVSGLTASIFNVSLRTLPRNSGQCQWLSNKTGSWEAKSDYKTQQHCVAQNRCSSNGACYRWVYTQ